MRNEKAHDLFLHEMRDIYDAEHRFEEALRTMADNATSRTLADGFRRHREVTRNQIRRLEECFSVMDERPSRARCAAAEGLVSEYEAFVRNTRPDGDVHDVFAAASALKAEHYEVASYATMIDLALRLDLESCAVHLEHNLREEEATAAELEMSARRLGAELTGSSAGLRGAIETLRAGSRSGGVTAVGRAVASQASGAIGRLEQRGRKAARASSRKRTTTRKKPTTRKTTARRTTGARKTKGRGTTTARRGTATRRPASRSKTTARATSRRPASRSRTGTRRAATRRTTARSRSTRSRGR